MIAVRIPFKARLSVSYGWLHSSDIYVFWDDEASFLRHEEVVVESNTLRSYSYSGLRSTDYLWLKEGV